MMPCPRPSAPPLLTEHGDAVGRQYAERRAAEPGYQFRWPQRNGRRLDKVALDALIPMTRGRCTYCDTYPIGASGRREIDHFRPKSREAFYLLVCAWENLFVACTACNCAKGEQWDDALLQPDAPDFAFARYFYYEPITGELSPAPGASVEDQHRARRTIAICDLNDGDKVEARKLAALAIRRAHPDELDRFGYRFLIDIVRE